MGTSATRIPLGKRMAYRLRAVPRTPRRVVVRSFVIRRPEPDPGAAPVHAGPAGCHRGRLIRSSIAREMARALGVVTCPDCNRTIAVNGRHGTVLRPRGVGWREI
jgi:hypothetical protein